MAIKGTLREASLPDVLQLLAMGQKTGCLSVSDRGSFGSIFFDRGRVSYASIVNRRDRLGDVLVKNGVIAQADLDRAISTQERHRDQRLGEILIEQGALSREELHRYIRVQIEEAVFYLFTWTQGTFSFEADVHPDPAALLVSINSDALLLEGARRVDEWSLIEKKVPGFDTIFALDRARLDASGAALTPEQERLVPSINGATDVAGLVEASGLGEFEVGKALYGLATAGFLHRTGKSRPAEQRAREARVEEHRNLGVAFYRTGMLEEAAREFRRVLELRETDAQARFYLALVAMREDRWLDATAMLEDAARRPGAPAAVYHNLAYALERQGRLPEARAALEESVERGAGDDPRVQTSLGILALRSGDAEGGDARLGAARVLWGKRPPTAAWFHFAALAAALVGDLDRARSLAAEGIGVHPRAGALYATLAAILERQQDAAGAFRAADKGAHEAPALPQVHKLLGDAFYRDGRYEEALDAYQRAAKLAPALGADIYFKLGNIRYKWQDHAQAVALWERALELDPENQRVRTNLELVRALAS